MVTTTTTKKRAGGVLRVLVNLLGRMRLARLQHGDCGGQMEVEVISAELAAISTSLESNAGEARAVDGDAVALADRVRQAIADGVVTAEESRMLRRLLARHAELTGLHHRNAQEIAG